MCIDSDGNSRTQKRAYISVLHDIQSITREIKTLGN